MILRIEEKDGYLEIYDGRFLVGIIMEKDNRGFIFIEAEIEASYKSKIMRALHQIQYTVVTKGN
jgi:hypothetical protein